MDLEINVSPLKLPSKLSGRNSKTTFSLFRQNYAGEISKFKNLKSPVRRRNRLVIRRCRRFPKSSVFLTDKYGRWAEFVVVLYSAPTCFSLGTPVFPSPQSKPTFPNFNSILECTGISERVPVNALVLRG